ncbi:class I SAM-dependent methyltransferase [Mucilaginibacter psychrotolerans]|uniref:Class I SAM-dependent methyltransferase n=1 Tax=Mucilaginibacter psychrotolerans TaxID=1524096 RepID=A0A4Y8SMM7_9SPHI|nr:class I SAM-dependent methyltransferase [Mucilaginibacter psychrotolerans]TFF40313.1 class I SAM-dependent methyltransferase [Mucilaginibacter psychrotolerans]
MLEQVKQQQNAYEEIYAPEQRSEFDFHITTDPLTRYLRDRRLLKALAVLEQSNPNIRQWSVLLTCGGVGGEGLFFKKNGFDNVTVSDISENSLKICNEFDASITTIMLNGENLDVPDASYDLVVVQDGLHHLPRPVTGFTEMLRVARKAVIVIEPYDSMIGNLMGTEWEVQGDATNYVYRWDTNSFTQAIKSYLLKNYKQIKVLRLWDHGLMVSKLAGKLPKSMQLPVAKLIYGLFAPFNWMGNMFVGVVTK